MACLLVLCFSATAQEQGIDCHSSPRWVTAYNDLQVNHTHIFCGEVNRRGRLVGFHSRPQGENPNTVRQFRTTQSVNSRGIYGGEWTYAGSGNPSKFSTMFPDRCTRSQVVNSIAYAQANQVRCPSGSPDWAWCGLNAPSGETDRGRFCTADDGRNFTIAGATNRDGRINTGFPLRR